MSHSTCTCARLTAVLAITCGVFTLVAAQDTDYVRALERTQKERPSTIASVARIAPEGEPGTPLVLHGRLFAADGKTPVPDAIVFAYHTDRTGLYNLPGGQGHSWRLRGWARTDREGRFEFDTIRPGVYPSRSVPAHVHFALYTNDARYFGGEIQFEDDSLIRAEDRDRSRAAGAFGEVRPVRTNGQRQEVDFQLRVDPKQKF
jgi:protocatechuate 3,4-dioxygenase, beta subunit